MAAQIQEEVEIQLKLTKIQETIKDAEKLNKIVKDKGFAKSIDEASKSHKKLSDQIQAGAKASKSMRNDFDALAKTVRSVFQGLGSMPASARAQYGAYNQNRFINFYRKHANAVYGLEDWATRGRPHVTSEGQRRRYRNPLGYGGDPAYVRALRAIGEFSAGGGGVFSLAGRAGFQSTSGLVAGGSGVLLATIAAFAAGKGAGWERGQGALGARKSYRDMLESAGSPVSQMDLDRLAITNMMAKERQKTSVGGMSDSDYSDLAFRHRYPRGSYRGDSAAVAERKYQDETSRRDRMRMLDEGIISDNKRAFELRSRSVLDLAKTGSRYSYSGSDAASMVARALATGGGSDFQGMLEPTLAASRLGLGPESIGMLAKARHARRQNLNGLMSQIGAIRGVGQDLGLGGAELKQYFESMVESLNKLETQGIAIDTKAMARTQMGLFPLVGGQRAVTMTQGLLNNGQQLAEGGPQDFKDILKLRLLYGMGNDFSSAGFAQARMRASKGQINLDNMGSYLAEIEKRYIPQNVRRGSARWEYSMAQSMNLGKDLGLGQDDMMSMIRSYGKGRPIRAGQTTARAGVDTLAQAAVAGDLQLNQETQTALASQTTGESSMRSGQNWDAVKEKFAATSAGLANAVKQFDEGVKGLGSIFDRLNDSLAIPGHVTPRALNPGGF